MLRLLKRRIEYIVYLLSLFAIPANANKFLPVLTNYSSLDYEGGLQNWSITQTPDGMMYFGNNNGVLSFDGYNWNIEKLPGGLIGRSVLADGKRIYIGSYEEFGYLEHNKNGRLEYTSLWEKLKGYKPHNDEIWKIVKAKNGNIIFQSFCSWFEFDGKTIKGHYSPDNLPLFFFEINGEIYAQIIDGGFCILKGDKFHTLLKRSQLNGDNVVAAFKYDAQHIMLCTEQNGLFLYDGQNVAAFHTDIDSKLKTNQLNRAIITDNGQSIILGTILGGLFKIDYYGNTKWHFDTTNSLQNNTILDLYYDKDHNLWAALDAGIALIRRDGPYTLLTGGLGRVYDVFRSNDNMYIATNQNTMLYSQGKLSIVSGTRGQNWHISRLGNELVVGNNHSTRIIKGNNSLPVNRDSESSSTALKRYTISETNDYLIEASYAELRIYRNVNNKWKFQNKVQGFMAPVRQLEVDKQGIIWATNMNQGCYRIELSTDLKKAVDIRYYGNLNKSKHNTQLYLFKIRGEVVLSDRTQLYIPDEKGGIKPFTELNNVISKDIISATTIDNSRFWLSTSKGYSLINYNHGIYHLQQHIPAKFFGLECGDNYNNVKVFENMSYFCLNGGIGRFNMNTMNKNNEFKSTLLLRDAYYTDAENIQHAMHINNGNHDVYGDVTLRFSYPNFNNKPLTFSFHIKGGGLDMTTETDIPEIKYSSLAYGSYDVECKVKDVNGNVIGQYRYSFTYPRPLLLSYPMIIVYLLLLALMTYFIIRWRTDKLLRRHMRKTEAEKIKQELELAKRQQIIEEQHKLLLEQQLQDKGREIASMAMDAMKSKDVKPDDEYWKLFQENFDLIHKQFFRHLREKYPSLTSTDLKFCAYLRLNLSTKDIANMSGLSIRGVEGARYRLRKKLNLKEGDDLAAFLIDFK